MTELDALRDYAGKIVALQRTGGRRGRWVSRVCGSVACSPFQFTASGAISFEVCV